jgi:hypothetical protein
MADQDLDSFVLSPHSPHLHPGGPEQRQEILEQYKLYVSMADKISDRRQTANSFFLGINTAVVAFLGYASAGKDPGAVVRSYWFIAPAGILLSYFWSRLIRSYRDLGAAKFRVIHEMERFLPMCPYDAEWSTAGRGRDPKRYKPLTHIEIGVPWLFLLLYLIVMVWNIPWKQILPTASAVG